jgi:hypothetical protein
MIQTWTCAHQQGAGVPRRSSQNALSRSLTPDNQPVPGLRRERYARRQERAVGISILQSAHRLVLTSTKSRQSAQIEPQTHAQVQVYGAARGAGVRSGMEAMHTVARERHLGVDRGATIASLD